MATITLRSTKGSPLTNNEVDANFTNLNTDKAELSGATFTGQIVAPSLDISGNIDVDGTTNLDVVDIDGAVDMASTLAVGGVVTANAGVVVDNITIDGTEIDLSSGDLTLDVAGNISLDADDSGQVRFKDGGAEYISIYQSSSDAILQSSIQDKDILFKGNDGGSTITALTLDMSDGGNATFNAGVTATELTVNGSGGRQYINSGHIRLSDGYNIEWGGGTNFLRGNNSNGDMALNATGNLTIDVVGAITLDADSGGDVIFSDGGAPYGKLSKSSNDFIVTSAIQDGDIIFKGDDGGANILALTLDMSAAGAATFNSSVTIPTIAYVGTSIVHQGDADTSIDFATNTMTLYTGGLRSLDLGADFTVFNTNGADVDFRVESNNNANMLFVDAGNDRITIGGNDGTGSLTVKNKDNSGSDVHVVVQNTTANRIAGYKVQDESGNTAINLKYDNGGNSAALESAIGNLTLDVAGDIVLDADGGDLIFADAGTTIIGFHNDSGNGVIKVNSNDKDLILKGTDNNSEIIALTLDMSAGGTAYFADDVRLTDNHAIRLGTDADIVFYHDNSNGYLENGTGDLTLDVAGDIILDSDGGLIEFKNGGTRFGRFTHANSNLELQSMENSGDILLRGKDSGGNNVTALTLDMSNAGAATFNAGATFVGNVGIGGSSSFSTLEVIGDKTESNNLQLTLKGSTNTNKQMIMGFDTTADTAHITTQIAGSAPTPLIFKTGNVVFNEASSDSDFRVESNGNAHMLFVDASAHKVGINQSNPAATLDIVTVSTAGSDAIRLRQPSSSETYQIQMGVSGATNNGLYLRNTGSTGQLQSWTAGEVVINDDSVDRDFRVESDSNANMLFVNAGDNSVNVGATSGSGSFNVTKNQQSSFTTFFQNTHASGYGQGWNSYSGYQVFIYHEGAHKGNISSASNYVEYSSGSSADLRLQAGGTREVIVNNNGANTDFRVESNSYSHMLFVDAGNNGIGIANSNVEYQLDVGADGIAHAGGKTMRINSSGDTIFSLSRAGTSLFSMRNNATSYTALCSNNSADLILGYSTSDAGAIVDHLRFRATSTVFNEDGADRDFRVEGDSNTHALFVEGSSNIVNFGRGSSNVNSNGGYILGGECIMSTGSTANTYLVRNTSSASYSFYVSGAGQIHAVQTSISSLSDERLKENIVDIDTGLAEVMALKPRKFDWREGEGSNEKNATGFVAQEVETVLPHLISSFKHDDLDDAKSVKMGDMVPTLVKAMQEQQTLIETLTARITALENA